MNDHFRETMNMISDTPRMKAAQMAAMKHMTGDVWRVGCDIERELNAANDLINQLLKAGDYLDSCLFSQAGENLPAKQLWRKAREAKS